jgi:hypothetical protein
MTKPTKRGGRRPNAGRPRKGDEPRVQKSVSLTPRVWGFIAVDQLAHGGSESDAIERICRSHPWFVPDNPPVAVTGENEK